MQQRIEIMSRIEELKQEIFCLPIAEQMKVMADLEQSIATRLGYEDVNIALAEQRLAAYHADQTMASSWEEVRRRVFE